MRDYQRERVGQVEYSEILLDNISTVVIPRSYIEQNQEFWDDIVFKLFEDYYFSPEEVSVRKQAKIVEVILGKMFEHKPSTEKPEDVITLK